MPAPLTPPMIPPLHRSTVQACSFSSWYPRFRTCSPKATILPLSSEFIAYLKADGLMLPEGCETNEPQSQLSDSESSEDEQEDDDTLKASFPELDARIRATIAQYGGSVFPKLNWSAPQDASFLLPSGDGALRCRCPADVYLLLKGSDFVAWDLEHAFEGCLDGEEGGTESDMVLKKWYSFHPAGEFRCFVRNKRLIGISSRSNVFHDFLLPPVVQASVISRISTFFESTMLQSFLELNFVFDVYLPSPSSLASPHSKPSLIDINPFSTSTSALLFSYEDLLDIFVSPPFEDRDTVELRLIQSELEASQRTGAGGKYGGMRMPSEVVGLADGVDVAEFARRWNEAMVVAAKDEAVV